MAIREMACQRQSVLYKSPLLHRAWFFAAGGRIIAPYKAVGRYRSRTGVWRLAGEALVRRLARSVAAASRSSTFFAKSGEAAHEARQA